MKIIVDKLPENCGECVFKKVDMLRGYCSLSLYFTDIEPEIVKAHCPLIEFSEFNEHIKYGGED